MPWSVTCMSVAARCDETERPGAARTWWTTGQRSTCISNSRRLHNYTQLAPPSYYNRLGQNGTAFQIVGSLSEAVSSHSMWGVPPCKSLLHAPVSARLSAARPAELSYDHGRRAAGHSGGSALSLGKPARHARHATLSSIPPTSKHSLVIHGALAVVVLIVQSSSSGRLRPAEERCDRTVWPRSGPVATVVPHWPLPALCGSGTPVASGEWSVQRRVTLWPHCTYTRQVTGHSYYRTSQPPRTHRARLDRGPAQWV